MKYFIYLLCLAVTAAHGQNSFKARIIDANTQEPLPGATAQISPTYGAVANEQGFLVIKNISAQSIQVTASYLGYERFVQKYTLPLPDTVIIALEHKHDHEEEEIIVTANRSSRTIDEIPTRIEVLTAEELEEKSIMRSNNIAMLLRESTGIQMQMTSAATASQSIRIQGLDGRHTQVLRDGFAIYSGFSSALSIMQIPPLDLKQVEVVKGSNSTLFGGGAIAGLVNLVTIAPEEERKLKLMLDQSNAGGTTANGFYAERFKKFGLTLYASANRQQVYDPNGDGFSDIPRVRSLSFNPAFYWYIKENAYLRIALNSMIEKRLGGDVKSIKSDNMGTGKFYELNKTFRQSYQITYENKLSSSRVLTIKHSLNFLDRKLSLNVSNFSGRQWSTFTELSYRTEKKLGQSWIYGLNLYSDAFRERNPGLQPMRDYDYLTLGTFVQNTTKLSPVFSLESGMRVDFDKNFGNFPLPRTSLLAKISKKWSARLGGGLGYRLPNIFTEEAESTAFQGVMPINTNQLKAEKSIGSNLDFNYSTPLGSDWTFSLNQLFFYTQLNRSLVFRKMGRTFVFENASGPVDSRGVETNLKLTYKDFKFFANYALIDTRLNFDNINRQKPLTPKHNVGLVLVYEAHGKWRVGFEAYYKSEQFRNDFTRTRDYWMAGFMAMRKWKNFGLYVNFENFTDTRQHRLENFNIKNHISPNIPNIWAPTDGFILNGGMMLEF